MEQVVNAPAAQRAPCLMRGLISVDNASAEQIAVFFEVPWDQVPNMDLRMHLLILVAALSWVDPQAVVVHKLQRERQVIDDSHGLPSTGDLRLFEVGDWHGPIYAEPERTWLLVGPATLRRLAAAQRALPIVDATTSMPMPL